MTWSAGWAWAILAAVVIVFVVVFDVHAAFAHTATMSGQMRRWLFNPSIGPFAAALWAGVFVGLMFHFFQYKGK